jgi:hypothetical protein
MFASVRFAQFAPGPRGVLFLPDFPRLDGGDFIGQNWPKMPQKSRLKPVKRPIPTHFCRLLFTDVSIFV